MPQITNLNLWEFHPTGHTLLTTFLHDIRHLALGMGLIYTLQWVTLTESVFVLTQNSPSSCDNHMTKPKISHHLTFYNTWDPLSAITPPANVSSGAQ